MRGAGRILLAVLLALSAPGPGAARAQDRPGVTFNQRFIEQALAPASFDIADIHAAFAHVFAALPPEVKVYPTENYYYFTFGHGGMVYAGNLRLDVKDRDRGVIHFAYFGQDEDWNTPIETRYKALTATDGVTVEKVAELKYRVTFAGKPVLFALNDLRHVAPPPGALGPGEEYLGPVFDESGVQFYFLLNRTKRHFLFMLNEAGPPSDLLVPYTEDDPDILIGARTGYAYVADRFLQRKVLVGVYGGNVEVNNYFDGPFDQLPDNFFQPGQFLEAVLTVYPDLKDELDTFGSFKDRDGRVLIAPYMNYYLLTDMDDLRRCREPAVTRDAYYKCLLPVAQDEPETAQ